MKFSKYERFIKKTFIRDGQSVAMVPCAYQNDRLAMFELGSLADLKNLQLQLSDIEEFMIKHLSFFKALCLRISIPIVLASTLVKFSPENHS